MQLDKHIDRELELVFVLGQVKVLVVQEADNSMDNSGVVADNSRGRSMDTAVLVPVNLLGFWWS